MRFKNLEGNPERKIPKRIIYANSGLGRLQGSSNRVIEIRFKNYNLNKRIISSKVLFFLNQKSFLVS